MMYNAEQFYPTPDTLIAEMLSGIDFDTITTILEPSAGKGNIVKFIRAKERRHYRDELDIDTIELSPELRHILKGEKFRVVHDDFLSYQTLKRYDLIVMNPPFRDGDRHLLHALNFARGNGRIVCILNAETLRNPFTNRRKDLVRRLAELKARIDYRQHAFDNAERTANVEIAMVSIDMPEETCRSAIVEHLRQAAGEKEPERDEPHPLIANDFIRATVERFNYEAAAGIALLREYDALSRLALSGRPGNADLLRLDVCDRVGGGRDTPCNRYLTALRYQYWNNLFNSAAFSHRLTSNIQAELCSRINEFAGYEFSFYNIYQLYCDLNKTIIENIRQTILKLFDDFTHKHAYTEYSKNVHYYNGWRTNNAFKVRRKVVIPMYSLSDKYNWQYGFHIGYEAARRLRDIEKVFDYLDGGITTDHSGLEAVIEEAGKTHQSRGIRFKHFTADFFKKGTCHLEFHRPEVVHKLNIFAGQQKNWLPPGYGTTAYGDFDPEAQEVIKSFDGDAAGYTRTVANGKYYLFEPEGVRQLGCTASA